METFYKKLKFTLYGLQYVYSEGQKLQDMFANIKPDLFNFSFS